MERAFKKRIFSGIQPSGDLHIGNYVGAISQWVEMQTQYDCVFCVVDYHAITVKQDPKILKKKIIEIAKIYLASGIDPKKSIIFQQSSITAHTELTWILNSTSTRMSDLYKMTQFKEKAGKGQENVSVGLFDYPVLMASDILLYNTDIVPVGKDQSQHVELARDLAVRFNNQYGQTFKIPESKLRKEGAIIMGLDDPSKKMSKSAKSEYNRIALTDKPDEAVKKIMRAVTDSGKDIIFDPAKKPAISNLLTIYSILANERIKDIERMYAGKGYGEFKKGLADIVRKFLIEFQVKYTEISDSTVRRILDEGALKADAIASKKLKEVKSKIGSL